MAYAEKLRRLRADINAAVDLENRLGGKPQQPKSAADPTPLPELLTRSVDACRAERQRQRDAAASSRESPVLGAASCASVTA